MAVAASGRLDRAQAGTAPLDVDFRSPSNKGHGVGTALLAAAVGELLALGYTQILSTFMLGNDSSMLWHWRNGFQLLSYPGSYRLMKKRWRSFQPPQET